MREEYHERKRIISVVFLSAQAAFAMEDGEGSGIKKNRDLQKGK